MKKKLIAAALVLALLMLTACGGSPSTQSSAAELLDAALSSQSGANELTLTTLNAADEGFSDHMTKVYGLGANTWPMPCWRSAWGTSRLCGLNPSPMRTFRKYSAPPAAFTRGWTMSQQ